MKGQKMSKFDKIFKHVRSIEKGLSTSQISEIVENKFNVGVYIDSGRKDSKGRDRHDAIQIWYKRGGSWLKNAGWITILN